MPFSNPLGSFTALSLAADPVALPVIIAAAGVAVTVVAATFLYKEYKDYEEKKHREEIEAINRLHKKYLAKIAIPDYNEIQGFPAIFKLPANKDSSKVESMHLTDEDIENIGKILPHGTDIALSNYRQLILDAILKLKEYYFHRNARNDTTAGVISYLLYMLETKCLNFEGYAYDIAYLTALTNFINAYASMQNRDKTQHFSRLNPVYGYLLYAKQALEKHKEALSLEEIIGELRDACATESNLLIRNFVKLIAPNEDWNIANTVTLDELAQGLLRKKYIHTEIKGIVLKSDDEKQIPDSIFKNWLMVLAKYYLQTINPDTTLTSKEIQSPGTIFYLTSLAPKIQKFRQVNNEMEEELKLIRHAFQKSDNFITTKLDPRSVNHLPKFTHVYEREDLMSRSKIIANYAALIHQLISLQYLCIHLLKSTKQLGEIYVKNPHHFCRIFLVLDELCNQVKDNIEANKKAFLSIQKENHNAMQLEEQQLFPEEIKHIFEATYAMVSRLGKRVKDYREKVTKAQDNTEMTIKSVKHEMLEVTRLLANIYHIESEPLVPSLAQSTVVAPEEPFRHPSRLARSISEDNFEIKPQPPTPSMSNYLDDIYNQILLIQRTEKPTADDAKTNDNFNHEINGYIILYNALINMEQKCKAMAVEKHPSPERTNKTMQLTKLMTEFCQLTSNFLQLNKEERKRQVQSFSKRIHSDLASVSNQFIDEHARLVSHLAYSVAKFSFLNTDSRKRITKFQKATNELASLLNRS